MLALIRNQNIHLVIHMNICIRLFGIRRLYIIFSSRYSFDVFDTRFLLEPFPKPKMFSILLYNSKIGVILNLMNKILLILTLNLKCIQILCTFLTPSLNTYVTLIARLESFFDQLSSTHFYAYHLPYLLRPFPQKTLNLILVFSLRIEFTNNWINIHNDLICTSV